MADVKVGAMVDLSVDEKAGEMVARWELLGKMMADSKADLMVDVSAVRKDEMVD